MKLLNRNILIEKEQYEEKKTESGIILFNSEYLNKEYTGAKVKYGFVKGIPNGEYFYKVGDKVAVKETDGIELHEIQKNCILVQSEDILCKVNSDGTYSVGYGKAIVKVKKHDREALFTKTITKNDGEQVKLFIALPPEEEDESASKFFVTLAEVVGVGEEMRDKISVGDTAIMNYNVDNDDSIILGYENDDKLVVVSAVTKFIGADKTAYANRKILRNDKGEIVTDKHGNPKTQTRDQIVEIEGDYDVMSDLLGVIHDDKLIAIEPFVFLNHEKTEQTVKTNAGIVYTIDRKTLARQILAVSPESEEKYGLKQSGKYYVDDYDIFDVQMDGYKLSCINDRDIMVAT